MNVMEQEIAELLDLPTLKHCSNSEAFVQLLAAVVTQLIEKDFSRLCQVLYRVDVDEQGLKSALEQAGEVPPGKIIADLLIERQRQKVALRQQFGQSKDQIREEDRW